MESKTLGIYPISLEMLHSFEYLYQTVYPDSSREYYWSSDFSAEFYIAQAKAGFMAICETMDGDELLLPEIQRSYAVLDFGDIHISRKVSDIIHRDRPMIEISQRLDDVVSQISRYHKNNWLTDRYLNILKSTRDIDPNFRALSVSIRDGDTLIAGEVGYLIGSTYTSLTGFSSRQRQYRDYGKVQMVLLAQYLQESGLSFWNLGHPYMPYKTALGAKIYTRNEFLKRWYREALGLIITLSES